MFKKNLPNFLTLCNLFCGCLAIVFASEGNLIWGAYAVGIACLFDFMDGMAARVLNVNSEIGKQLDSLADMVSFGVVPGIILYQCMSKAIVFSAFAGTPASLIEVYKTISEYQKPIASISFLVTIFSAIRLAKFNLDDRQTDSFIGLPTPANTLVIASFPLIINSAIINTSFDLISFCSNPFLLIFITLFSCFMLVAPLPLFSLKFKNFSWTDNKMRYILLFSAVVLLALFQFMGIPLIIFLYIILSVINNLFTNKSIWLSSKQKSM